MNRTKAAESKRDMFDPYIEGYESRLAAVPRTANPYAGCDAHRLWDDGWMEGDGEGLLSEMQRRRRAG
jgi:hypothetical protein